MKKSYLLPVAALALSGIGSMQASIINGNSNGLIGIGFTPGYTLTFDSTPGLAANSVVTNQYGFAGVSFSSPAYYDGNNGSSFGGCAFSNQGGDCVTNFTTNGSSVTIAPSSPFSILFSIPQAYVAFALVTATTGSNNTTIQGLRNGVVIEQFNATTGTGVTNNYYGFYAETTPLDQIRIIANAGSPYNIVDNLQLQSTPEPATWGMFATGVGGLIIAARRRRLTA